MALARCFWAPRPALAPAPRFPPGARLSVLETPRLGIELPLRPHQSVPMLEEICWDTHRLAEVTQAAGVSRPSPAASSG